MRPEVLATRAAKDEAAVLIGGAAQPSMFLLLVLLETKRCDNTGTDAELPHALSLRAFEPQPGARFLERQHEAARLILAKAAPGDTGIAVEWAKRILEKQERTNDE